jgi:cell division protein FtsN
MANFQRGVYEPQDDLHVFDGSEDDEDNEGSRLPLLIVIALFVLASFGGVVWLAYERGVVSGRTEPRTIAAQPGPAKVAVSDSAAKEPYKGLKIYEQPSSNESYDGTTVEDSGQSAPASPTQTNSASSAPQKAGDTANAKTAPHDQVAKVIEQNKAPPASEARPAPPTEPSKPTTPDIASGQYVLQIGSYPTRAEAEASWDSFKSKHASVVQDLSDDIKAADLGGKGTWYRLRLGPFTEKGAANAACEKIKAAGGSCFLTR